LSQLWLEGSIAVLVYGARLGVDVAAENPKSKKKVCVLSAIHEIPASARRTESSGRKEKEQTCVYTLLDLTKAEHVPHARLEQFTEQDFEYAKSGRPTLFLSADGCDAVRATAASTIGSDQATSDII
jgi:hypothetical protein